MTTPTSKKTPSLAEPILRSLGRANDAVADRSRTGKMNEQPVVEPIHDRRMEEEDPERWDGMS